MFQNHQTLLEQSLHQQQRFLKEAEHERLLNQVRRQSKQSSLRQQLGQRLVWLGQLLVSEPEAELA